MSESADELSIVQSDIRPGPGVSRKRGRPPKHHEAPVKFEIQLPSRPPPQHAEHVYIPPGDDSEPPRPKTPATGPKKRRRPKGSTVANILARHHSTSVGTVRRPGRPPRDPNATPKVHHKHGTAQKGLKKRGRAALSAKSARDYYLEPGLKAEFICHPCLWEGCKAELQNLETLRRHVKIVHGPARWEDEDEDESDESQADTKSSQPQPRLLCCRWGKCARYPETRERKWAEEQWSSHIEQDHLVPYSWHMGDGVKNTSGAARDQTKTKDKHEELPEWLFDKNGKQITPDARNVEVEDTATAAKRSARLKALQAWIFENMPEEEA